MDPLKLDINKIKSAYLIGIKGSAMTALAEILVAKGIKVIGSDIADTFYTDALLKKAGIKVYEKFDRKNIPASVDLFIYSTAYNIKNNPEMAVAARTKIPLLNYPEALGLLFNELFGIAVCGTHGKTTTTAMLAEILRKAKMDPTALVGSKVANWGSASLLGKSRYFVIEADEYQNKLQYYNPKVVVNTNIDYDHPDFFKKPSDYSNAFRNFFRRIPNEGFLIINSADKNSKKVSQKLNCKVISFGRKKEDDFHILSRKVLTGGMQKVEVVLPKGERVVFILKLAGEHNALNALAAIAAAYQLGIPFKEVAQALKNFESSERRFQKIKKFRRGVLYDDYAHHPQEIKASIKAAREQYPSKRIIVAFHPHTFSRTKKFFKEFAQALALADKTYLIDIYGSAREKRNEKKFNSKQLVVLINELGGKAEYKSTIEKLAPVLIKEINEDVVFVSMGAGDIWKIHGLIK